MAHWLSPHLAGMHILRGARRVQSVRPAVAILELVCGLACRRLRSVRAAVAVMELACGLGSMVHVARGQGVTGQRQGYS